MPESQYDIMGCPCVAFKDYEHASQYVEHVLLEKKGGYSVAINADKILLYLDRPDFKPIVDQSILPSPDGFGALLGMKWIHKTKSIKLDLPKLILELCNKHSLRLYMLGASPETNALAQKTVLERYPNIELVGGRDGYFKDEEEITATIHQCNPDVVMVAMGSPKQEFLASRMVKTINNALFIGCGGAFDVLAGTVKRAPSFFINNHIEWLYRLAKQPSRIKRQKSIPIYFFRLLKFHLFKK
jgi:N-acetylglucosaminyldiphosphoundecaprenol N-acetyl-beta-D-mannosaminyltransferase